MSEIEVILSKELSKEEKRYIIVDKNTGLLLDDAQGYGYTSKEKAINAYKFQHKEKRAEKCVNKDETNIIVVESNTLSKCNDKRYVIIDKDTGVIVDDAQGFGYKSKQKAYAAYTYKNRDKSKYKEYEAKIQHIRQWLKEHKGFCNYLEEIDFEIAKGSWAPEDKLDTKLVKQMLKNSNLTIDFSAYDLLKVWRKYY